MDKKELEKRISSTNNAGLIALLYEALIDNFTRASKAIEDGEYSLVNEKNNHCRAIFTELMVQFSGQDQVSRDITEIILYLNKLITRGQVEKNTGPYKECIEISQPILEGFQELETKLEPRTLTGLTYGRNTLDEHILGASKSFEG